MDPVTSRSTVLEWIEEHPDVRVFIRKVKLPNPGRDLHDDIEEMRAIRAYSRQERFSARRNKELSVRDSSGALNETFSTLIEGIENGSVVVQLQSRGPGMGFRFSSDDEADGTYIDDFGDDWELGIELVFGALRRYSDGRDDVDEQQQLAVSTVGGSDSHDLQT